MVCDRGLSPSAMASYRGGSRGYGSFAAPQLEAAPSIDSPLHFVKHPALPNEFLGHCHPLASVHRSQAASTAVPTFSKSSRQVCTSCAWLPMAPSAGRRSNMGFRASWAIGIKLP